MTPPEIKVYTRVTFVIANNDSPYVTFEKEEKDVNEDTYYLKIEKDGKFCNIQLFKYQADILGEMFVGIANEVERSKRILTSIPHNT